MDTRQYDIFLSYSRRDIDRARWFINLFEGKGLSVFWDLTSIPPGITFHQFIRQSLDRSCCVVVLWTEASVKSEWVDIEAREGKKRGVLIPVLLDALKEEQLPFGLHIINATALHDWDGKSPHRNLDLLLRTIYGRLGKENLESATDPSTNLGRPPSQAEEEQRRRTEERGKDREARERAEKEPEESAQVKRAGGVEQRTEPARVPESTRRASWIRLIAMAVLHASWIPVIAMTVIVLVLVAGVVFWLKDGDEGTEMVVVPAGTFQMGDIQGVGTEDEKPVHQVRIPKPFAIGKYEVTFEEYDRFAKATGRELPSDEGWGRGRRPVINVSWVDAVSYAEWLSGQTAKRYRLPSEAEWEYVARAGTATVYWWGDDIGTNRANCDGCGSRWDNKQTAPVASFEANGFGLFDTAGNVHEWVQDCWYANYEKTPDNGAAREEAYCAQRVIRGGSWYVVPWFVRSAHRDKFIPESRDNIIGFRLAQDIE